MRPCPYLKENALPIAIGAVACAAAVGVTRRSIGTSLTEDLGSSPDTNPVDKLFVENFSGDLVGMPAMRECCTFKLTVDPKSLSRTQHILTNLLESLHAVSFCGVSTLRLARLVALGCALALDTPALAAAAWSASGGTVGAVRRAVRPFWRRGRFLSKERTFTQYLDDLYVKAAL